MRRFLILPIVVAGLGLWAGASPPDSASSSAAAGQACAPFVSEGTSPTGGGSAIVLPVTLDQLTDESSDVIAGTVKGFQSCLDQGSGSIVTRVVLASTDFLKASGKPRVAGDDVTIEVLGGEVGDIGMRAGTSPEFKAGEQVVVFLRDSAEGVLHLSEGRQSKFELTPAGLVKSLNLPLAEFKATVRQAAQGVLPPAEDTLVGGEAELPPQGFTTIAKWAPTAIPVPYHINPNTNRPGQLTAQDSRLAIIEMFGQWQNVSYAYVAFRYAGDTTRTSGGSDPDGQNDITWRIADPNHGSSTLAITYMWYNPSTGYFIDTDIEIDTDHFGSWWTVDPNSVQVDLPTVMLHEEGHVVGLGHSNPTGGNCPVMKPSYTWGTVQRTPCSDDIAGVRSLYPEQGGNKPPTPTGLTASPASATSINVSWQDVATEYGYEVWRADLSCSSASSSDFALIDSVDAVSGGVITYLDDWYGEGLAAGVYCYKVRAFNLNGESPFSNQDDASLGQSDSDGDGWTDAAEIYIGTDPSDSCPNSPQQDAWPPDTDRDTDVDIMDVLLFKPAMFSQVGQPSYNPRFDLDTNGTIDILDLLLLKPYMWMHCV